MADQHNSNIPALTNQVAADIPDIKENLEFHKDAFQLLFETWSDTDNSSNVLDSALGFSNGTYTFDFPTNSVAAHAVIMCGNSSTIIWMYLNAAPPGWKVTATGKDTVLAVYADSGDYAVAGGSADTSATWTIDGLSSANESAHTHAAGAHTHEMVNESTAYTNNSTWAVDFSAPVVGGGVVKNYAAPAGGAIARDILDSTIPAGSGNTAAGSAHSHTVSQDASWRPSASVGKLFQLDSS